MARPTKKRKMTRKALPKKSAGNPGRGAFARCVAAVSARGTVRSPRGVCAAADRKKYGAKKFAAMARAGRAKKSRRNPDDSAAESYEFFHGHEPEEVFEIEVSEHIHSVTWGVGKLVYLKIAAIGDPTKAVTLGDFGGTLVSANEKRTQLFFKGGNQAVNLRDFGIGFAHEEENLGALLEMGYDTNKTHLTPETGGKAVFKHKFGQGGKRLPMIVYDVRNKQLSVVGGEYKIEATGIKH